MKERARPELTPQAQAALNAVLSRTRSAEVRAEHARVRGEVQRELPPLQLDPAMAQALASLRAERERLGLSLADVSDRTGLDKASLSRLENGKIANPTIATLRTYAAALGKRFTWSVANLADSVS